MTEMMQSMIRFSWAMSLFGVRQAAEMMSVHTGTLRRWIQAGRLRATKPGRHWRIPERSLRELVEKGSGEPEPRAR